MIGCAHALRAERQRRPVACLAHQRHDVTQQRFLYGDALHGGARCGERTRRDRFERLEAELGPVALVGDATEIHILERAGIARPPAIVLAVTGDDEDNLVISQIAKDFVEEHAGGKITITVTSQNNTKEQHQ